MDESERTEKFNSVKYSLACLYCDTERYVEAEKLHNDVITYRLRFGFTSFVDSPKSNTLSFFLTPY